MNFKKWSLRKCVEKVRSKECRWQGDSKHSRARVHTRVCTHMPNPKTLMMLKQVTSKECQSSAGSCYHQTIAAYLPSSFILRCPGWRECADTQISVWLCCYCTFIPFLSLFNVFGFFLCFSLIPFLFSASYTEGQSIWWITGLWSHFRCILNVFQQFQLQHCCRLTHQSVSTGYYRARSVAYHQG